MSATLYGDTPEVSQQVEHNESALLAQALDVPEGTQHLQSDTHAGLGSPQAKAEPCWRRMVYDSLLAFGGVALLTGVIALTDLYSRIPTIGLVYLLVIVTLASTRGLYAAILASLLAVFAFDYFLVPPAYSLIALTLEDVLMLVVFLITALQTSTWSSLLRKHVEEARRREQEPLLLYEQAQQLAALQERRRP